MKENHEKMTIKMAFFVILFLNDDDDDVKTLGNIYNGIANGSKMNLKAGPRFARICMRRDDISLINYL